MCSCTTPQWFLKDLNSFDLPGLPYEIVEIILKYCKSDCICRKCNRIIAQSINSYCNIHCSASLTCKDCS